ncbi:hypothetical protein SLS56_007890 [Neofusicoccum ribis]|uniref:Uncharacterized protein n=1 Tax=Neofusicoccum ribis TaxID=45134 RepID=A0ABR3SLR9_9PEZI
MKPYTEEAATPSSTSDFDSSSPASSFYNCIENPHCRTFVTEGFVGGVEVRSKTGKAVVLQKVCRSLKRRLRKSFVAGFEAKKPTAQQGPSPQEKSRHEIRELYLPCPGSTPPEVEVEYRALMEERRRAIR